MFNTKNKDYIKEKIKLIPYMVLSAILIGLSVNLYVSAGLGSDSITIFEDGLHNLFNTSLGVGSWIYALITLVIGYIVGRKYISVITIFNAFLCGPFINLFNLLFKNIDTSSILLKVIMLVMAIITTALSCAILIYKDSGTSSLDAIVLGITDKCIFEYKVVRTITDIILFIFGILMKGQFGIGSIIATLSTGTVISYFVKVLKNNSYNKKA